MIFEHVAETAGIYGEAPAAIWDLFSALGYRIFAVTGGGPLTRASFSARSGVVNWLAVPDR